MVSSDSLRSLKSRRSLEVEFTLESSVWSHSGVCSLDSLRSLEESPDSGVCSLELLRSLVFRFTPEAVVLIHSGV